VRCAVVKSLNAESESAATAKKGDSFLFANCDYPSRKDKKETSQPQELLQQNFLLENVGKRKKSNALLLQTSTKSTQFCSN
jgi:hypothetical protein